MPFSPQRAFTFSISDFPEIGLPTLLIYRHVSHCTICSSSKVTSYKYSAASSLTLLLDVIAPASSEITSITDTLRHTIEDEE